MPRRTYAKHGANLVLVCAAVELLGEVGITHLRKHFADTMGLSGISGNLVKATDWGLLAKTEGRGTKNSPSTYKVVPNWRAIHRATVVERKPAKPKGVKAEPVFPRTRYTGINSVFQLGQQNDQDIN